MIVKKYINVVTRREIEGEASALSVIEPLFAIETHMSMEERLCLATVAYGLPQGFVACEVGSYLGASACFLAAAAQMRNGAVHCVDMRAMGGEPVCDNFSAFARNTAPFRDRICVHRGESSTIAGEVPNQLDLLFLDGDHSYAAVKSDLTLYGPKVKTGGFLLLHDYVRPDVRRACDEFLPSGRVRDLGVTFTLQVFQLLGE